MSHRIHLSHTSRTTLAAAAIVIALVVGAVLAVGIRAWSDPRPGLGFEPPQVVTRVQAVAYVPERHSQFTLEDNLSPMEPQAFNLNGVVDKVASQPISGGVPPYAVDGWHAPATIPISGGQPPYSYEGWSADGYEPIGGGLPVYAEDGYEPMSGGVPDYAE
ncbi:hypothetical protein [Demequina maris]|uniref:hypothetical protein n=1 Tax=Demequina maris TaxID=1638982 RepID=UPI000781FEED|nr:hypothetical protein [Demequina maris]